MMEGGTQIAFHAAASLSRTRHKVLLESTVKLQHTFRLYFEEESLRSRSLVWVYVHTAAGDRRRYEFATLVVRHLQGASRLA